MASCAQCGREFSPGPAESATLCPECAGKQSPPADSQADAATYHRPPRISANTVLIAANVVVYVVMVLRGVSWLHPSSEQLLPWGANFGPWTLDHQSWRLFTCIFVHIGVVHLLLNMWPLYNLGELAEGVYGQWTYLAIYLLCGVAGSIGSIVRHSTGVSAGASGAIFGVAGALIATLSLGHFSIPRRVLRVTLIALVVFAVYSLVAGFRDQGIDNGAHVGGFVAGLFMGAVLARDFRHPSQDRSDSRGWLLPLMCFVLAGTFLLVRRQHSPQIHAYKAEEALGKGNTGLALAEVNAALAQKPDAGLYLMQGDIYLRMKQTPPAEAAFQKAIVADPKDVLPRHRLAELYLRENKVEEARAMLEKITQVQPKDALAWFELAVILQSTGKPADAIAAMQKSVAANPNFPPAQFNLGLWEMAAKNYDVAIQSFLQETKLEPNDAEGYQWLGNAYQAKGMDKEAQAAYVKAYQLRRARAQQQR